MDIMNNMTVSSSKFTFSIIAIAALFIGGSAYLNQEAFGEIDGEASQVPTFIAVHNSTTTTEIIFQTQNIQHLNADGTPVANAQRTGGVNGTAQLADWKVNGVVVTGITNGTAYTGTAASYGGTAVGVFNKTSVIMLTHADIGNTAETTVQYLKTGTSADIRSYAKIKANDTFHEMAAATITGIDQIPPTALSAKMVDAKRIQVTMSESIGNWNTTANDFQLHGANTGGILFGSIVANNGTNGSSGVVAGPADSSIIYLTTNKPIPAIASSMSISYTNGGGSWERGDGQNIWEPTSGLTSRFLTDDTHSYVYGCASLCAGVNQTTSEHAGLWNTKAFNHDHVGNRLANFTGLVLSNSIFGGSSESIYTNSPPQVTASSVQVNSKMAQALTASAPINVDVEVGDLVTFDFVVTDDDGSFYIPTASVYTNFIDRPDDMNLFYTNNFDTITRESTSFYEWNVRSDDVAYDYSGTLAWNDASYTVIDNDTVEITFSFEVTNTMNPSEVWFQVGDNSYNFNNQQLGLTLDVTGDELLNFENTSNQQLLGFLNESVLSTMVTGWNNSSDDMANVEQLTSALGVQDQVLPAWTTDLASWVVNDDIYAADMIVAVEYIINQ